MGTLKYAILGLLNRQNMTGYDLSREFETTLFEFWSANHSQIYPELRALTEDGLTEYRIEISGSVLEKKLYSITEKGRQVFLEWEKKEPQLTPTPKDEFRLRLFFSEDLQTEERIGLLKSHLAQHEGRLAHLRENMKKFPEIPPRSEAEFSDYLVLNGAVMREETTCAWLSDCIRLCRERG